MCVREAARSSVCLRTALGLSSKSLGACAGSPVGSMSSTSQSGYAPRYLEPTAPFMELTRRVERAGGSRSPQTQIKRQRRLPPVAHPDCYAMIQNRLHLPRCIAALAIALALATSGCGESGSRLADSARKAGTAKQWHTWAAQVIEGSRTNSSLPAESEWPDFVRHVGAGRQLLVETNGTPLVMLVSFGGFQSIGLVIGPSSYVETNAPGVPITSKPVYPGIYVRESH
jgi:hypothetical protein